MRLATIALMFFGLSAVVGCGASQTRDASADIMNDPSWQPPGQGDLTVADAPEAKAPPKPKKARHLQQPNHREMGSLAVTTRR